MIEANLFDCNKRIFINVDYITCIYPNKGGFATVECVNHSEDEYILLNETFDNFVKRLGLC